MHRLHNDDVHSYEDVTTALQLLTLSDTEAAALTLAVDKLGEAKVKVTNDTVDLQHTDDLLRQLDLIVSMTPEDICMMEGTVVGVLQWMKGFGGGNVGLRYVGYV